MAEDAEDRFKRAMDRIFSSPATPPSSNAGRGREESGTGIKPISTSINRTKRPSWFVDSSPLEANLSSNLHRVCRPWDRGDLFRRLATFKSMTWFGKPEVAGPVNCARKGWVNVDADLIACEGCNAMLSFPCPPAWSHHEVGSAAASFSEKLDSGHKAFCPWKENACSETLAHFPPTPVEVLVEGFKDRCDALYQLSALPMLSNSAIDYLKKSKGPQMEQFISQTASNLSHANGTAAVCTYFQAQRIISLCGWELRLLPYVVDCEDDNTDMLRKNPLTITENSKAKNTRFMESPPKVLLYSSKKQKVDQTGECSDKSLNQEQKCDVGSAVLDCTLCGASVGLWLFSRILRPSRRITAEPLRTDTAPLAFEFSAASGVQRGSCDEQKGENTERSDNVADAATSSVSKVESKPANVLTLKLTIAGGPRPTQLCLHSSETLLPSLPQPDSSKRGSKSKPFEDEGIIHVGQVGSLTGNKLNSGAICGEKGENGRILMKRKRTGDAGLDERETVERNLRVLPCLSSVDAVDTCFVSRPENSAESVEMPQARHQSTAMSVEDSDCITQRSISDAAAEHTNSSKGAGISGYKSNTSPMVDSERGIEETASDALMDGHRVGAIILPHEPATNDKKVAFEDSYCESGRNDWRPEGGATLVYNRRNSTEGSTKGHESATEALCPPEKSSSFGNLCDKSTREFDPILQHRHFCPWVNTNLGRGSCGWQLTLDALETSPAAVRSESASSTCKADPLSSVRKIFGGHKPFKKQ